MYKSKKKRRKKKSGRCEEQLSGRLSARFFFFSFRANKRDKKRHLCKGLDDLMKQRLSSFIYSSMLVRALPMVRVFLFITGFSAFINEDEGNGDERRA